MKSSFKAVTTGGTPITWDSHRGFGGDLAYVLNQDMKTAPGQTFKPPAEVAKAVLLDLFPKAVISDFVSVPLPPLPPGRLC